MNLNKLFLTLLVLELGFIIGFRIWRSGFEIKRTMIAYHKMKIAKHIYKIAKWER